ncbi:Txe/YoeB family addiction module toxin [Nocardia sp. NEAU-G5]|uniref:Endoribonuclease YoeB n=1 Tax=Nocardia albiluteola TaxID=2842303 RepID=A0ABS6ASU0_9NOCA|nr:Txe/YoeB family addiction module toxin [Nocardia albiluteola]MBU3061100.1 Txe/YoeB family addiction module toxin [Nocardia albiluteola]
MSDKIGFTEKGLEDYDSWDRDPQIKKRIKQLLRAAAQDPFRGIGKPEPLRGRLAGHWSRRITQEHRLLYFVDENGLVIVIGCRGHYDD